MSQAAVLRTCQMPCRSGCPSRVFGGVYVPEVCAAPGVEASVKLTKAASAATDPANVRFTGILLSIESSGAGRIIRSDRGSNSCAADALPAFQILALRTVRTPKRQ